MKRIFFFCCVLINTVSSCKKSCMVNLLKESIKPWGWRPTNTSPPVCICILMVVLWKMNVPYMSHSQTITAI